MKQHALKIENLDLTTKKADNIVEALNNFLIELNFSEERIDGLDCRSRGGFSPYSHNNGGLGAIAFMPQLHADQWLTPFKTSLQTLEKYQDYDIKSFCESKGITEIDYNNDDLIEELDSYRDDSESTILFSCDLMLTSESNLNVRVCVCVKDAPYHRSYDDKFELDIKFKNVTELKRKLKSLNSKTFIKAFKKAVQESY